MSKRKPDEIPGKGSKRRMYDVDYIKFGFIATPNDESKPFCLLCSKSLCNDSMRPGKLEEHLASVHSEHKKQGIDFFKALKRKFDSKKERTLQSMFSKHTDLNTRGLKCSYEISQLIAKNTKPHTVGENLIKPCIEVFLRTVQEKAGDKVNTEMSALPLSNDSVRRRIDEMSNDVEEQLVDMLRETKFSLALDESTVRDSEALLLSYVRFVRESAFAEEMFFCASLKTTTTAADIFAVIKMKLDQYKIPMSNIMSTAADGAPAMMGRRAGVLKLMKDEVPDMMAVHCVVHRENLASKNLSPRLNSVMKSVIKVVNLIKAHPKMDRLFRVFCQDMDEQHVRLVLHTAVRWLSKGNCLERFIRLYDTLIQFATEHPHEDFTFLESPESRVLVSYLADIFGKFNVLNTDLQGKNKTLIDCKSKITAFIAKLKYWKSQIGRNILTQFPHLSTCSEVTDDCRLVIIAHLEKLTDDMNERFGDMITMNFPDWLTQPFLYDCYSEAATNLEDAVIDEILEIQNDDMMRPLFDSKNIMMWLDHQVTSKYPTLASIAQTHLLPFPTTYLVECGFSTVNDILTKKRGTLDITKRGDLRIKLTNLTPNISKLVAEHCAQGSH